MNDKEYTAYEIWKAIHYTHPQKLLDEYGFDSTSEFELIEKRCMVKHWYRVNEWHPFMCDISNLRCIKKSKYCLNCSVYKKHKKG